MIQKKSGEKNLIRKITRADKELYLNLTAEFYRSDAVMHPIPAEYCERTFEELMRSDCYAQAYILCNGQTPAGYALVAKTYSQEAGGAVLWIDELYISPEHRGKGLGKEFFAFAETLGAARIRLEAERGNARAIKLYRSLGFEEMPYFQMMKEYKTL